MRKTALSAIIIIIISNQNLFSQSKYTAYTKNCVYFELMGQGILYSINYEDRFASSFSYRIGFGTIGKGWSALPVMINYLTGKGNHHLEAGLGIVGMKMKWTLFGIKEDEDEDALVLGTMTLGYRYQHSSAGLMFKIGFTPLYGYNTEQKFKISPCGGISLGYAF